ncbi:MAG: PH domain-containing protein [Bifidobacteriaceae bacterium]|jgi:putative membrane protein|nr:PH domain-containing protein [Bifidobacteriaceae bacterium]
MTAVRAKASAAERGPGDDWRRLHPATPFLRSWGALVALVAVGLYNLHNRLGDLMAAARALGWHRVGLGTLVLLTLAFAYAWVWWRRAYFQIGEVKLEVVTGVLFRRRRTVRLDRIEAVDTVRPLIPRLSGLVKLKIETAGGSGSAVELAYLKMSDAAHWRQVVLTRAAAAKQVKQTESATHPAAPKSTETQFGEFLGDCDADAPELFAVPTKRVIASLAVSAWVLLTVLLAAGAVTALVLRKTGVAAAMAPGILTFGSITWKRLISDFGFSAKQTERGLTLSHGLTTRVSQTITPGRILAVQAYQGPIWRRFGWWRAKMNVAGYGSKDSEAQSVLVPVGDLETIRRAIWAVAPALAQMDRWELITAAMTRSGPTAGFTGAPRRARLLDPLAWKRTAFAVTPEALILRKGALLRSATLVAHGRLQGLEMTQGPWSRRRDLAAATFHTPDGPVTAHINHLAATEALALIKDESDRLNQSMAAAQTSRPQPDILRNRQAPQ